MTIFTRRAFERGRRQGRAEAVQLHHFHVSGCDDATIVNVTLTTAELEGVARVAAAARATSESGCQPVVFVDDPEHCYRRQTYGTKDGKWQVVEIAELPDDPVCREWWESRRG